MDVIRKELNLAESDFPDDSDVSVALSGLLIEATKGKTARYTLDQVHRAIISAKLSAELDPLTVVPLLLPSPEDVASQMLDTVAENTSAKELVIACEEATERLKANLINASEEEDDDLDSLSIANDSADLSPAQQVARLLRIYSKALPRLRQGKRSASAITKPLLSEIELLIRFLGQNAEGEDGRDLVAAVAQLVFALAPWISLDAEDKTAASEVLYSLTNSTLEVCSESFSAGVAQKAFEKQFPRLRMPLRGVEDSSPSALEDIAESTLVSATEFVLRPRIPN
ncbi:hypothetical protein NM688_g9244 [Phlebia brevispora]|uniref:Uncharacterized protein n=1 Tax=Phlebia brevispora TaxID=194682 RepID=A0ACC1RJP8_9APHY|nr:hypothetical protein NM688_g9244 [Phlebia brevispora]